MNHSFPSSHIRILIFTLSITLFSIPLHTTLFSLCFLFNPFYFSHSIFWHSHILSTFNNESICLYSPTDPPYTTYLLSSLLYLPYFDTTHSLLSLCYHFTLYILKPYPPRHLSPCTNLSLFLQLSLYNKDNHILYFFTFYFSTRHSLFSIY